MAVGLPFVAAGATGLALACWVLRARWRVGAVTFVALWTAIRELAARLSVVPTTV